MITARNLLAHEWIGLNVTVKESPDPRVEDIAGPVRNETRNTLVIESKGRSVTISKQHNLFAVILPNGQEVTVDGNLLMGRPEDRVKRGLSKW